jgi:hypothetical protein
MAGLISGAGYPTGINIRAGAGVGEFLYPRGGAGFVDHNLDLAPTSTKLIMGDGRTIKPLGIACNINVIISRKCIPTDFLL